MFYRRRTNSHKAWTQGTNPITQRSSYSSSNGNLTHQRQTASPRPNQKESNTSDNHAHDRLVFLFASFIVSLVALPPAISIDSELLSRVCKPRLQQSPEINSLVFSLLHLLSQMKSPSCSRWYSAPRKRANSARTVLVMSQPRSWALRPNTSCPLRSRMSSIYQFQT